MQQSKRRIAAAILVGKLALSIIVILAISKAGGSRCRDRNSALALGPTTASATMTPPAARNIDLSLIIPTTYADFLCYRQRFFKQLYNNVVDLPEEIIFVVSSVPANISKLDYPKYPPGSNEDEFDSTINIALFHSAHNAAQNRNIGALTLATGEFLTFFDMDDIFHPQRFQVIKYLLLKEHPHIDAALFGYVKGDNFEAEEYEFEDIELDYLAPPFLPEYLHRLYHQIVRDDPQIPMFNHWCCEAVGVTTVANGWGTYRREIFHKYQYNEGLVKGEDSDLNVRLMLGKERFSLWEVVLGYYEKNGRKQLCGQYIAALN